MTILRPLSKGRFRAQALFSPKSVGVLGASTTLGQTVLANLLAGGFAGGIWAAEEVAEFLEPPDLAVIAGAPERAAEMIQALADQGTYAAICVTPAPNIGAAARQAGVRVMGPAAFGVAVPGLGLNATTGHLPPGRGKIALVSQSAALCRSVLDWAGPNGVGFSHIVGLGGAADMGFAIVLDWLSRDPGTGAILLDIRSIRNRKAFMSAARAAARLRPVVAIRAGGRLRDPSGRADLVFDAALRRAGIVRVGRLADLLAAAETLTRARPPRGEAVVIVTNAVGPGQMAADAAAILGIPLAPLTAATRQILEMQIPPGPSDLGMVWTGPDQPIRLAEAASLLSGAPEVGGLVVVMAPSGEPDAAGIQAMAAAVPGLKVPLLAAVLGETTAGPLRRALAATGVPVFNTPELAMRGFGQLVEQARARAAARELPSCRVLAVAPDQDRVRALFQQARDEGRLGLRQDEALAVLAAYGMPVVPTALASTPDQAAAAARAFGFPAVLKLARSARPEAHGPGAVMLDLLDEAAVRQAAALLDTRRARLGRDELLVQHQMGRARELRVTVSDDALFGPAIGFGQGGSAADLADDQAMELPPLNLTLAASLIARTRVARTLAQFHDQPAASQEAVADALVRISQLVVDFPEIAELDLNPLFAAAAGVRAGDCWIGLRPPGEAAFLSITPYPADLAEHFVFAGETLLIRPIRPEDAEAHNALFGRLTPEDIRYRFFSMVRALSPEQIARMTQVDYDREIAFIGVRETTGETLGVARLVRETYLRRAEFAIVVEPSMKGRGLGRRLMQRIIGWARLQELVEIEGQVLAENGPMLAFMRRLGFTLHRAPDDPEIVNATIIL